VRKAREESASHDGDDERESEGDSPKMAKVAFTPLSHPRAGKEERKEDLLNVARLESPRPSLQGAMMVDEDRSLESPKNH